ncbi:tRNA (adenosine(37)-N6)-threonylcarbamoyltransferase complex dimerization subunit type 1 TsaB [Qipengyuania sp. DGS5-3]|uniref:tRNA (adenosine(37)-N6)-threonylcarbamoyltransferase complex dimerization subunit type 1 TsaB n=1 Tax=Qipengyuania sp. DGS5-3 TaxID=3349632 RepID=UPI0036D29931
MRTLAIDCATEACTAALFDSDCEMLDWRHDLIGRGHAERLVPMVSELPEKGRAERILVGLGPGSFTGTRIGLAAARALGIAWGAQVLGIPTLALVAAGGAKHGINDAVLVVMKGGHGELFVQPYSRDLEPEADFISATPDKAAEIFEHQQVLGNGAEQFVQARGHGELTEHLPDARNALCVPAALHIEHLAPIYGRAPDAKLPQ